MTKIAETSDASTDLFDVDSSIYLSSDCKRTKKEVMRECRVKTANP